MADPADTTTRIDLDKLLELRVVVARYGEMDLARWWNTTGQLGRFGTIALRRGLPRTHRFAQARSVFAVAGRRCAELFDPPQSVTLWSLPAAVEEEFDARWEHWLDAASEWEPFFVRVESIAVGDLMTVLREFELLTPDTAAACGKLRRSLERKSPMQLAQPFDGSMGAVEILAAAFSLGEPGAPVVPYARLP